MWAVDAAGGTAGGRWQRKKLATREALLAAARELFDEQGFAATTVQQITDAADVSERTFFRYFDSKDDLLITGIVAMFDAVAQELAQRPLGEAPLEAMRAAVHAAVSSRAQPRSSGPALLELDPATSPAPGRLVRQFVDFEERLSAVLLDRMAASGCDPGDRRVRLTAAVAGRAGMAALRGVLWSPRGGEAGRRRSRAQVLRELDEAFAVLSDGCPIPSPAAEGAARGRAPSARTAPRR